MRTSKKVLLALLPLVLLAPSLAFAATNQTSLPASLVSGPLSIVVPTLSSAFPGVILNGQVQTVTAGLSPWQVTDATGTGDGWTVTLSGNQFTELAPSSGFASGTSALTLPDGSLSLSAGGGIIASSGASAVDPNGGPLFQNLPGLVDGTSFTLLNANQGYGLGNYSVSFPSNVLSLTIDPATTKVDSINYPSSPTPYQEIMTWTLASGPSAPTTFTPAYTSANFPFTTNESPTEFYVQYTSTGIDVDGNSSSGASPPVGTNSYVTYTAPSGQTIASFSGTLLANMAGAPYDYPYILPLNAQGQSLGQDNISVPYGQSSQTFNYTPPTGTVALDFGWDVPGNTGAMYGWYTDWNSLIIGTR